MVRPYGEQGLVRIATGSAAFVRACEAAMVEDAARRLRHADAFLRQTSWDGTWSRISRLLADVLDDSTTGPARQRASGPTAGAVTM